MTGGATGPGGGLVLPFRGFEPVLGERVFIAPQAVVIGRTTLGARASVWFHTIVRADIAPITIGADSNIQDHCVMHVGDDFPCTVGERCVVGHRAILHGCTLGDEVMVGMGAILLNGCKIGSGSVIAAGALIPEGREIPPGSLVMGSPGKVVREASPAQLETTRHLAAKYARVAGEYLEMLQGRKA